MQASSCPDVGPEPLHQLPRRISSWFHPAQGTCWVGYAPGWRASPRAASAALTGPCYRRLWVHTHKQGGTVVNHDQQLKADVLIEGELIKEVAPNLKVCVPAAGCVQSCSCACRPGILIQAFAAAAVCCAALRCLHSSRRHHLAPR